MQILQPDYVAGRIGIVISPEVLTEAEASNRWIIQVADQDGEAIFLSLDPDDFVVIS
ncbi:MAG: hypothetical protein ACKO7W_00155 [Elainella sp.]